MKKINLLFVGRQVKDGRTITMRYCFYPNDSSGIPVTASRQEVSAVMEKKEPYIIKYVSENVYGSNSVLYIGTSSGEEVRVQSYSELDHEDFEKIIKAAIELKASGMEIEITVTNFLTEEMRRRSHVPFNPSHAPHATSVKLEAIEDNWKGFKVVFRLDDSDNLNIIDGKEIRSSKNRPLIGIKKCAENQRPDYELVAVTVFNERSFIYNNGSAEPKVFERLAEAIAQSKQNIYFTITM